MLRLIIIICYAIYFFSPCLYAAGNENPQIAIGTYFSQQNNFQQLPLIAVSHPQEKNWTYISKLPDQFITKGKLSAADCNTNYCVAVGSFYDKTHALPLVAITPDQGNTWSFVSTYPTDYRGSFDLSDANVTCTPGFCIISSGYQNNQRKYYPFLAISRDNGKTWDYPSSIISRLPKDKLRSAWFKKVSCNNDVCVAVGSYFDEHNILKPLISYSTNRGNDWSYSQVSPELQNATGVLSSVKCTNNSCVAIGWFLDASKNKPFIITSFDHGVSWYYTARLPIFFDEIQFYNINYDNDRYLVVGYYGKEGQIFPLFLSSKDNGISWQSSAILNSPTRYGFLQTVSCNGNICMAGGIAVGDSNILLALSKDHGATWSFINTMKPLDYFDEGTINNIICKSTDCTATGKYISQDGKTYPLLGISQDNGESWKFPSSIISGLPQNLHTGIFLGNTA